MKSLEEKIVDALKEMNENKSSSIFDVFRVMMKHCGDDVKNVTFSGTRRIKDDVSNPNDQN
jgi:hypothetical protein